MKKKGQITIFVIIAILIVVAGVLVYNFAIKPSSREILGVDNVKSFVSDCIDTSLENVIVYVGRGGGYYIPPVLKSPQGFSYYYDGVSFILPTRERMEVEIEKGVNNEILFCLNGFKNFTDFDIESGKVKSNAKIFDDRVELNVELPISIKDGEKSVILKDFKGYSSKVRLGEIHNGILKLFGDNYYVNGGICIDCLIDFMEEKNINVDIYSEGEDDLFVFTDSLEGEEAYKFMFANKK